MHVLYQMAGFEPGSSGIGSDHRANCVPTILKFSLLLTNDLASKAYNDDERLSKGW